MGIYTSLGFYPIDGYNCPTGIHNIIPEFLRPYIPTFKNTFSPFFSFYDFSRPDLMPLGIKLFPDRYLISQKRKLYNLIVKFDIQELEKFLEKEKENSKILEGIILDDFQLTALGLSCVIGNIEAVHYLLLKGVNIEQKNGTTEKTPLHLAVENNHELLVKFLLAHGANPHSEDKYGFNCYDKAENRGIYNMKNILNASKAMKHFNNANMEKKDVIETFNKNLTNENESINTILDNQKNFQNDNNAENVYLLNIQKEKKLNFDQIKLFNAFTLENITSPSLENFIPSDMLEINMSNLASKNFGIYDAEDEIKDEESLINLESFNFYSINIPSYDRIHKDVYDSHGFKINNKIIKYDDLIYAKI